MGANKSKDYELLDGFDKMNSQYTEYDLDKTQLLDDSTVIEDVVLCQDYNILTDWLCDTYGVNTGQTFDKYQLNDPATFIQIVEVCISNQPPPNILSILEKYHTPPDGTLLDDQSYANFVDLYVVNEPVPLVVTGESWNELRTRCFMSLFNKLKSKN